jgi:leucyl/phenylalanyl-tRNA--protein transferase
VSPSRWELPRPRPGDPDGLVGVGADLAPGTLVDAYRHGVFPWPHEDHDLPWFSPDPRAVLPSGEFHVARSLRRTLRGSGWQVTVDTAFDEVMRACGVGRSDGTWITPGMLRAYVRLHGLGWAHSVEVWERSELVGGVYGVQVGAVFTGESMFHRRADASKVALLALASRFADAGGVLLDAQLPTPHLRSLGFRTLPRHDFLSRLEELRERDVRLALERRPAALLAGPPDIG